MFTLTHGFACTANNLFLLFLYSVGMTSCHGFTNIKIIYLLCLYFYFLRINYYLSHTRWLPMYGFPESGLVNLYFPKLFALHAYGYFDLDLIVLIWKHLLSTLEWRRFMDISFNLFGLSCLHMFIIKVWRQSFLKSIINELCNLFDKMSCLFLF